MSCTVHATVWKVILYLQVAEQTAAREEGGIEEEKERTERDKEAEDTAREEKEMRGEEKQGNEERRQKKGFESAVSNMSNCSPDYSAHIRGQRSSQQQ